MNKIFSKIYIKIFSFIPLSLNNFLAKLFKKFHNLHLYSSYEKDFLCNLDILNTNFKLWLLGKDIQAQSVYKKLHNTSDIYELQLVRIIKSIIETEKYTSFLDIGAFMGYFSCYIGKKNLKKR